MLNVIDNLADVASNMDTEKAVLRRGLFDKVKAVIAVTTGALSTGLIDVMSGPENTLLSDDDLDKLGDIRNRQVMTILVRRGTEIHALDGHVFSRVPKPGEQPIAKGTIPARIFYFVEPGMPDMKQEDGWASGKWFHECINSKIVRRVRGEDLQDRRVSTIINKDTASGDIRSVSGYLFAREERSGERPLAKNMVPARVIYYKEENGSEVLISDGWTSEEAIPKNERKNIPCPKPGAHHELHDTHEDPEFTIININNIDVQHIQKHSTVVKNPCKWFPKTHACGNNIYGINRYYSYRNYFWYMRPGVSGFNPVFFRRGFGRGGFGGHSHHSHRRSHSHR